MQPIYYTPDPIALIFVTLAGGVLALDRATVRTMLSAPIVAAPLVAALLGLPYLGLLTGLLFQLFWLRESDAPGRYNPDAGFGAMIASAVSASLVGHLSVGERLLTLWPYGVILGVLVSPVAGYARWSVIQYLSNRLPNFDAAVLKGDVPAMRGFIVFGAFAHFFAGALAAGLAYLIGYAGWQLFSGIWFDADPTMLTIIPIFAGIGISAAAKIFLQKDTLLAFIIGSLAVTGIELLHRFTAF